jgi:hypothetical protein
MLTATELQNLLIKILAGAAGGAPERWRELMGEIELLPLTTNPKCNWRVKPMGTNAEVDAIDMAAGIVRQEHPHVRRD